MNKTYNFEETSKTHELFNERHKLPLNSLFFISFFLINFVVLIDPTDNMTGLKYPFFIITLTLYVVILCCRIKIDTNLSILHILLIIFLIILAIYSRLLPEIKLDIQYNKSEMYIPNALFFILLLFPALINRDMYILSFKYGLFFLLLASYFLYILLLSNIVLFQKLVALGNIMGGGFRDWNLFSLPMIYIKSCVLLVFMYPLFCEKKHWIIINIVITFCLTLTGTRANIIAATVLFFYTFYIHMKKNQRKYAVLFLFVLIVLLSPKIITILSDSFFSPNESSMNIKSDHLKSYINLFRNKPDIFLLGSGAGAMFYTSGFRGLTSVTELTYLESIRVFGILLCIPLVFFLLVPLIKTSGMLRMAYLMYLFVMGTNPLLYSSTGVTAIVFVYTNIRINEKMGITDRVVKYHKKAIDAI